MVLRRPPSANILSPSERVVHVVSSHADTDPLELPALYRAIEPDALDAVIDTLETGTVEFTYAGYHVSVHTEGTVNVDANRKSARDSRTVEDD